jgi:hypothetical protein
MTAVEVATGAAVSAIAVCAAAVIEAVCDRPNRPAAPDGARLTPTA